MTISHAVTPAPRFARLAFTIAGLYGLLVTTPLYWLEGRVGRDFPPPITHPEYYYGFIGVVLAWQLVFLLIARSPTALRAIMPVAVVEKLGFGVPALVLYAQHRAPAATLGFGAIDLVLGSLFLVSYLRTDPRRTGAGPGHLPGR